MNTTDVIYEMMNYFSADPDRIQHFLKVHGFAKVMGKREKLNELQQFILEVAALTHDIGIKMSEEKYDSSAGKYQEKEGPPIARQLLQQLGSEWKVIERVCYLIAHHHTYDKIDGMDYQILVEADFLVNAEEEHMDMETIRAAKDKIFKTESGKALLDKNFLTKGAY